MTTGEDSDVRLGLRRTDRPNGRDQHLDGGWWPRTLVLEDQIDDVLTAAAGAGFRSRHVTYRLGEWSTPAKIIRLDGVKVRLGGFRSQLPHTITLVDASGWKRLEILVVPPDTPSDAADRALTAATDDRDDETATTILARS